MNTVLARRCQTLRGLQVMALCALTVGRSLAAAEPASPPPAWQQDIDAAHLLENSLLLAPARNPTEQEARHARLQTLYRDLARKHPQQGAVQKTAADFFSRDGQPEEALPYWEKAARLDPRDGDTADRLGGIYLGLGRIRPAYEQFQRAVDAQPNVPAYHYDLANVIYLFRHDLRSPPVAGLADDQSALMAALGHFRKAAELAPGDLRLAKAYAETFYVFSGPDWNQALAAWQTVRSLSGDQTAFPDSHLARISLRLGQPDAAAGFLARIHDPAFDGLKAQLLKKADQQRKATPRP